MILDFDVLWQAARCPASAAEALGRRLGDCRLVGPADFATADGEGLEQRYAHHQEALVRRRIVQVLAEPRQVEGESWHALEGETWREIGWHQSMANEHPLERKYTIEQALAQRGWPDLLGELPLIMNACLSWQGIHSCFDILVWFRGAWHGVLVRASNKVKDSHIAQAELNRYIFNQAGLSLGSVFLLHPREDYLRLDPEDSQRLFVLDSLNHAVKHLRHPLSTTWQDNLARAARGEGCGRRSCSHCAATLPKTGTHSIYTLHKGGKAIAMLEAEGIVEIADCDRASQASLAELTEKHHIQIAAVRANSPQIRFRALEAFLARLAWPLHFLDFECYSQALCPFPGTHPWELVPFLASLQIQPAPGQSADCLPPALVVHGEPGQDARPLLAEALVNHIGPTGSVLGYGMALERTVIQRLARLVPRHKVALEGILARMVDLQEPFANFDYYHPDQRGKLSLKVLLPLLTRQSHATLDLQNGGQAHLYWACLSDPELAAAEGQASWIQSIRDYAALDAHGLVDLLEALRSIVSQGPVGGRNP